MFTLTKAQANSSPGALVAELTPLFVYRAWGYNTTAMCQESDYLGELPSGTKLREQKEENFKEWSNQVKIKKERK